MLATRSNLETFCGIPEYWNVQAKMVGGSFDAADSLRVIEEQNVFCGLMERFPESFSMLGWWIQDSTWPTGYVALNKGGSDTRDLISNDSVLEHVREVNQADIEVYAQVTSTVFPQQRAAFEAASGPFAGVIPGELSQPLEEPLAGSLKRNLIYKPLRAVRLL